MEGIRDVVLPIDVVNVICEQGVAEVICMGLRGGDGSVGVGEQLVEFDFYLWDLLPSFEVDGGLLGSGGVPVVVGLDPLFGKPRP